MTNLATDTFTGTNGAAFSSTWTTGANPTTGGSCLINTNRGRFTTGSVAGTYQGGNRIARKVNITAPTDAVALFSFQWPSSVHAYLKFYIRSTNTTLDTQGGYFVEMNPDNNNYSIGYGDGSYNNFTVPLGTSGDFVSKTWAAATKYWCRFGVVGSTVQVRVWNDGSGEPSTWDKTATDTHFTTAGSGCGFTIGAGSTSGGGETIDVDDFSLDTTFPGSALTGDATNTLTLTQSGAAALSRVLASANALTVTQASTAFLNRPLDAPNALVIAQSANAVNSTTIAATNALSLTQTSNIVNSRVIAGTNALVLSWTATLKQDATSAATNALTLTQTASMTNSRLMDTVNTLTLTQSAIMGQQSGTSSSIDGLNALTLTQSAAAKLSTGVDATNALTLSQTASGLTNRPIDSTNPLVITQTADSNLGRVAAGINALTITQAADSSMARLLDSLNIIVLTQSAAAALNRSLDAPNVLTLGQTSSMVRNSPLASTNALAVTQTAVITYATKVATSQVFAISQVADMTLVHTVAAGRSGGWQSLISIYQQNQDFIREDRTQVPLSCPNDGEPLSTGPHGEVYCRFDGWRWNGQPLVF